MKRVVQLLFGYREKDVLKLVYDNEELKVGKKLRDYLEQKRKPGISKLKDKWAFPYKRVIWIAPRHIEAPNATTFYTS